MSKEKKEESKFRVLGVRMPEASHARIVRAARLAAVDGQSNGSIVAFVTSSLLQAVDKMEAKFGKVGK